MAQLNETHDPTFRSWVESANRAGGDFPLQNLPFAAFRRAGSRESFRIGVAIGDQIVDVAAAQGAGAFSGEAAHAAVACEQPTLNRLMALGPSAWSSLRLALSRALRHGADHKERLRAGFVAQANAEFSVPATVGGYTDFYTSIHHATAVGRLFRPDNPLLPNYKWVPIGYHGRVSSLGVSRQTFRRPRAQILPQGESVPIVAPSGRIDFELELGIFIGVGNALGQPIPIDAAEQHVFGMTLLNDWSARDVQPWEYQPLGPFLSKNFATTISPWVVTLEALAPYRAAWSRPDGDPQPLPYLDAPANRAEGAFDIQLEVQIETEAMRAQKLAPATLARSNYRHAYWTVAQLVAHHTVNGCNLGSGDLLGTGTLSGPAPNEAGSLLELTAGGKQPVALPSGEQRTFLEDGDAIVLRAWCMQPGRARIGFGEATGQVLPAAEPS
ncbi:MAG TPA: fumarylacetoacetase [Burkholderiaceae bacterium]|nr:fumarylacetoacetase [Burkholderiaceae bacterium]